MTEEIKKSPTYSPGVGYVLSSMGDARARLAKMKNVEEFLRDLDEVWEAYCDIEQAIAISKFVFRSPAKLGKIRKLQISSKCDPLVIPADELRSKYEFADSNLVAAGEQLKEGNGEKGIELARRARDELKILLLSNRKSEKSTRRRQNMQK
ncbi:MAG: hypothetical protein ACREBS_02840 [Nitrososphaerales archaeon]